MINADRPLRTRRPRLAGFTLVEIMAVIALIGILAALILGVAGYVSRKGDIAKAQSELEKLKIGLEEYKVNYGRYYPNSCGASTPAFVSAISGYVSDLHFTDPWNHDYQYEARGINQFRLWSYGPDGVDKSSDDIESIKQAF